MSYYLAWGEGEAGEYTIYGLGESKEAALRDSVQYGYDYDAQEPYLFTDELSEEAYNYLIKNGGNDADDDMFMWDKDGILVFIGEDKIKVCAETINGITRVNDFEDLEDIEILKEEDFVNSLDSLSDEDFIGAEISNKTYKNLYKQYGIRTQ